MSRDRECSDKERKPGPSGHCSRCTSVSAKVVITCLISTTAVAKCKLMRRMEGCTE